MSELVWARSEGGNILLFHCVYSQVRTPELALPRNQRADFDKLDCSEKFDINPAGFQDESISNDCSMLNCKVRLKNITTVLKQRIRDSLQCTNVFVLLSLSSPGYNYRTLVWHEMRVKASSLMLQCNAHAIT